MHAILFSIVLAAQAGRPDLVITAAGINADGHFTFTLMNRGDGAVGTPFKVDAWLDGYLRKRCRSKRAVTSVRLPGRCRRASRSRPASGVISP